MRKNRYGRYLPIFTAVTAMALSPSVASAQSTTEKAESAVSGTAEKAANAVSGAAAKAKDLVTGAPAPGTTADVLSKIHETDETEIYVGKLAEKKAASADVRSYGKELLTDHKAADRKVQALAKEEGIQLSPPGPVGAELAEKRNHDGAEQEMLANVKGDTFDRDFLEAMSKDHQKDIDALTQVAATTADKKLKHLIEELLPKLKQHQEMAAKLLAQATKAPS